MERPFRTTVAHDPDGPETVSVATFRLARAFRAARWDEAVRELNDVAARLAERLGPTALVEETDETVIDGRRARVYEIGYERDGTRMRDRVAFLLVGRREYQLTCRIDAAEPEPGEEACGELFRSFRLS